MPPKKTAKPCPVPDCDNICAPKTTRNSGYRWGCIRCIKLSKNKPDNLLAFGLTNGISQPPPRTTRADTATVISPRTQKIHELEEEKQSLKRERDMARIRSTETRKKLKDSDAKLLGTQRDLSRLSMQLSTEQSLRKDSDKTVRRLVFSAEELKSQASVLAVDSQKEHVRLESQVNKVTGLAKEVRDLKKAAKDMELLCKAREDQIEALQTATQKEHERLDSEVKKATELAEQVRTLEQVVADMTGLCKKREDRIAELETTVATLKTKLAPVLRGRKTDDPAKQRVKWAQEFADKTASPRGWGPIEICHFAVGLCKRYKVSTRDFVKYYQPDNEHNDQVPHCGVFVQLYCICLMSAFSQVLIADLTAWFEALPLTALHDYLSSLLPKSASEDEFTRVSSLIPVKIQQHIIAAWTVKIKDFWSPGRCAYIKSRCLLSNDNWLTLTNVLFRSWKDGAEGEPGRYVTKQIDGVKLPVPWGRWTIDKLRAQGREEAGVIHSRNGLAVWRPFIQLLKKRWNEVIEQLTKKHGEQVSQSEHLTSIIINPSADKAHARGARAGVTVVAARVATPLLPLASSMCCTEFLSYNECNDNNADLQTFAEPTLTELNTMFKAGTVTLEGKVWPVVPRLSGDGAYLNSCFAHSSFLSSFPCPLCRIQKQDLVETRLSVVKAVEKRTLTSIRQMTHRECSVGAPCEGCGLWVCDTEEDVAAKGGAGFAIRVCRGDPSDPDIPWKSKKRTISVAGRNTAITRTWDQWHYNVVYGQEVIWHVEPSVALLCTLHMDLQITPLLIAGLVARHLDPDWKSNSEGPQTVRLCAAVSNFGRDVTPLEEPAKFPAVTGNRTLYKRHGRLASGLRVDGSTARSWHAARLELLGVVFPDRNTNRVRNKAYKRAVNTWDLYVQFRKLCHSEFDYEVKYGRPMVLCTRSEVQALWDERADEAETVGQKFLEAFRQSCSGFGELSWYLHCVIAHIPDNIRLVGRLSEYSTEALEAGHAWMNRVLLNGTNHIKGERMLQVMTAKTTEECVLSREPELKADSDRKEVKKIHTKNVRQKAAIARANTSLHEVKTVLESGVDADEVAPALQVLKRAGRQAERDSRRRPKKESDEKKVA